MVGTGDPSLWSSRGLLGSNLRGREKLPVLLWVLTLLLRNLQTWPTALGSLPSSALPSHPQGCLAAAFVTVKPLYVLASPHLLCWPQILLSISHGLFTERIADPCTAIVIALQQVNNPLMLSGFACAFFVSHDDKSARVRHLSYFKKCSPY